MFLVPLHDIHFKIIWPEEKNALNRLFCVRNKKFKAVLQPYFRWENLMDDLKKNTSLQIFFHSKSEIHRTYVLHT